MAVPSTRSSRDDRHDDIVAAARALSTQHGGAGFTVDQVAALAGVSRRTVFNHFTGVDELLVTVCEQILTEVTADLLACVDLGAADVPDDDTGHRALAAVCEATREVDIPTAIITIHHVVGGATATEERSERISRSAFEHVAGRLRERLLRRAPDLDPVDLELSLALLFNGIATLARIWVEDHPDLPPDVPAGARRDWDRLLDRLLHRLRVGLAG